MTISKKWSFGGQKWAIFGPKMSQKCPKLFFIFINLKNWWSMLSFIHIGYWKNREIPSIISKWAKNAVLGAKMGHFWPKNESEVSETVSYLSQRWKLMKYAKFQPYWILKNREIPSIISKWAKNAVLGQKISHFWPQNESKVSKTVFIFICFKSWWSMPSLIRIGY